MFRKVSDDEQNREEHLYHCFSPVGMLQEEFGFLRRGDEYVYFDLNSFYLDSETRVKNLTLHLKIEDYVTYNARRLRDGSPWRATVAWTVDKAKEKKLETINEEGRVFYVTENEGLASFGPNPYENSVLFTAKVFYRDGIRGTSLKESVKVGDMVQFVARNGTSSSKAKWRATCAWRGVHPEEVPFEEEINNGRGSITKICSYRGVIVSESGIRVRFNVDDFRDDEGNIVADLEDVLNERETVNFDAKRSSLILQANGWTATSVWKGEKPKKPKSPKKMEERFVFENCRAPLKFKVLKNFCPEIGIVTIRKSNPNGNKKKIEENNIKNSNDAIATSKCKTTVENETKGIAQTSRTTIANNYNANNNLNSIPTHEKTEIFGNQNFETQRQDERTALNTSYFRLNRLISLFEGINLFQSR